eukprot:m.319566 g.319566  ORF g.319566 m.319566 type:complete len:82 (-) comp55494_c0_seq18:88-333(-)
MVCRRVITISIRADRTCREGSLSGCNDSRLSAACLRVDAGRYRFQVQMHWAAIDLLKPSCGCCSSRSAHGEQPEEDLICKH